MAGRPRRDISGQIFGRLKVLRMKGPKEYDRNVYWICKCECGKRLPVRMCNLISGHTRSCGCLMREINRKRMRELARRRMLRS